MNFIFISRYGKILPVALRVLEEGHEVSVYIDDPVMRERAYNGLKIQKINRSQLYRFATDKNTVKVFDDGGLGAWSSELIDGGHTVIGACSLSDKITQDQNFLKNVLEQAALTYTNQPSNYTVAVGGWFSGWSFLMPGWIELDHYYNDRRCLQLIDESNPAMSYLVRLEPVLKNSGYIGPVTLYLSILDDTVSAYDLIVNPSFDTLYALIEAKAPDSTVTGFFINEGRTPLYSQNGFFATSVQLTIQPLPLANYMLGSSCTLTGIKYPDRIHGEIDQRITSYMTDWVKNNRVSITSFPSIPITGLQSEFKNQTFLLDAKSNEQGDPVTAGGYGHVLTFAAHHQSSLQEAADAVTELVDFVKLDYQFTPYDFAWPAVRQYDRLKQQPLQHWKNVAPEPTENSCILDAL